MNLARYKHDGHFDPVRIAAAFRTIPEEVARAVGLGRNALQDKGRVRSDRTQRRLREMLEIINRVEPWFEYPLRAFAWYCSDPLFGFSGQTAMILVNKGRASDVLRYLDAVDAGVYV